MKNFVKNCLLAFIILLFASFQSLYSQNEKTLPEQQRKEIIDKVTKGLKVTDKYKSNNPDDIWLFSISLGLTKAVLLEVLKKKNLRKANSENFNELSYKGVKFLDSTGDLTFSFKNGVLAKKVFSFQWDSGTKKPSKKKFKQFVYRAIKNVDAHCEFLLDKFLLMPESDIPVIKLFWKQGEESHSVLLIGVNMGFGQLLICTYSVEKLSN